MTLCSLDWLRAFEKQKKNKENKKQPQKVNNPNESRTDGPQQNVKTKTDTHM